ncbi:MAG: hypothetical protein AB7O86_05805 [Porticoccaceae bacterium]
MTLALTPAEIQREIEFLTKYPHFAERPATFSEFLGPRYLNIEKKVRKRIKHELSIIMGEDVSGIRPTEIPYAMITGGIGIGKTTIASIVLPYLAHWVLCLKDPQDFYGLLPGSRIAFMQMSTSEKQALEVVFGDIKARIQHSPWFANNFQPDPKFTNQIRFPKDVWIIPGDSHETTFEGYNILGGILDEADSHMVTKNKDYAEQGYNTIDSRISSRFENRGFLLVIGQMKSNTGFAARKYKEFCEREDAYAVRLAIWDSQGEEFYQTPERGNGEVFYYDIGRRQIIPPEIATLIDSDTTIKVPALYRTQFNNGPEKALKDLAGIPPIVGDPFISLVDRIYAARDRWIEHHPDMDSPVDPEGRIEKWFRARNTLKRVGHLDLAYSDKGDALGFAMGHVSHMVDMDGELKPYIVIDMLMRMQAPPGGEIMLALPRHMIYELKDVRKFRLTTITMDGFQSTDTRQQLQRRRFEVEDLSVDKQILPYHDLREAIYEHRIEIPPYIANVRKGENVEKVEIAMKELEQLVDAGKKIDHPENGSKDVADAIAGVTCTLMGDPRFHKKQQNMGGVQDRQRPLQSSTAGMSHPAYRGDGGSTMTAPLPPNTWS